jgi:superfamily II DNA or RNA helicase
MSIEFKALETSLSRNGYAIPKDQLTEKELAKLKEKLIASPVQQGGYVPPGYGSFPIYLESPKKIYMPRYYGIEHYGKPKVNKLKTTGVQANMKFDGSLRPYQVNIANIYLEAAKKVGGGIISIGCGRGKTVIGLYIAAALNLKTLVVVHKEFLAEQWKERILGDPVKGIKGFLPTAKVGLLQGKIIDVYDKDIVIAMVQSLSQKSYSDTILQDFGLVIYDECHHLSAEIFSRALIKTATRYTLGLSATPTRKDGLTYVFKYFLGDTVYSEAQNEDSTILIKAIHYVNEDPVYSEELLNKMGDLNRPKMINNICSSEKRNSVIINQLQQLIADNRKVLVLSDRKEHLNYLKTKIAEQIPKATSGLYVGGMKQSDLKISEDKDIILGTYPMVSEGFDCPSLDTVILASPKSDVVQSVGRIMRKKPEDRDRQHIVIDIIDYFGNFAQQWQTRKKYYKKQKYQFDEYLFNDNGNQPVIKKGSPPKEKKIPKTFNKILFLDEDEAEEPQDTEADAEAEENPDEPCDSSSEEE